MRLFLVSACVLSVVTFGGFWYVSSVAEQGHGSRSEIQRFEVRSGETIFSLAQRLEAAGIIRSHYAFLWQLARDGKTKSLVAGTYAVGGDLTIVEIAFMMTEGKTISRDIRVTFPEGWNSKKMAERLKANGLPGEEFLALTKNPHPRWREQFDFLADSPSGASLEGFLFPDTYFFDPESSADIIIEKMLTNFGKKVDVSLRATAKEKKQSIADIVTLASIVENEVKSETDRKKVADLFWRRLAVGQVLQSCATLQYILGVDRLQYSYEETRTESPYNTYIHPGLPPGPIGNPGLVSLRAVLFPESNPYLYFLSDPKTGQTIFSVTYDEHVNNKNRYGL